MKTKRLDQLQFLRFIAFGFIFLFHAFGSNLEPHLYTTNAAYAMVSFFFILSGFGSGYSSADRREKPTVKAVCYHLWKKIKKIYPLLFVTTIYFVLQSDLPQAINTGNLELLKENGWNLMKCLFMIQSWGNPFLFYNGVTWFISTILFLYLFDLPVRYYLDKAHEKKNEKTILISLSVVFAIAIFTIATLAKNRVDIGYCLYAFPPSRVLEYLLGMCMGRCLYRINSERKSDGNIVVFTIVEGFALLLWVVLFTLPIPVNAYSMQTYWLIPNVFVLIIMAMGMGGFSKLFSMKLLKGVGDISMECYLLHQPVLMTYMAFVQMENTIRGTLFYIIFNLGFIMLLAMMIHKKQ
ncbi:MAG: acyltransferase family protein [Ruminococcus sp.]|uniref:acyltransferase family protein n=1 Tax=Ruminococcus sp. TaxID=41978 RepID=UPI003994C73F